jgi:hypothetical protein
MMVPGPQLTSRTCSAFSLWKAAYYWAVRDTHVAMEKLGLFGMICNCLLTFLDRQHCAMSDVIHSKRAFPRDMPHCIGCFADSS